MNKKQIFNDISAIRIQVRKNADISFSGNLDFFQFQSFIANAKRYILTQSHNEEQKNELLIKVCLNELVYHVKESHIQHSFLSLIESIHVIPSELAFYAQSLFENDLNAFSSAFSWFFENALPTTNPSKTIAAFYRSTRGGGAANVMKDLALRWKKHGYNVVIIAEKIPLEDFQYFQSQGIICETVVPDSVDSHKYLTTLELSLRKHSVDYFVYHEWHRPNLLWSLTLSRLLEIPYIIFCHGSFSYKLDLLDPYFAEMPNVFALANGIITLSATDQQFWSMFNPNCFQTINSTKYLPINSKDLSFTPKKRVLWLGRKAREKHPEEAAKIFLKINEMDPDISFDFIGSEKNVSLSKRITKILSDKLTAPTLNRETWTDRAEEFYKNAGIFLLTSETEGFCLTLAESKSFGLPAVMYDIPTLSFSEDGRGITTVRFGDYEGAAQQVVDILHDPKKYNELARQALESACDLFNFDHDQLWNSVFVNSESYKKIEPLNDQFNKQWTAIFSSYKRGLRRHLKKDTREKRRHEKELNELQKEITSLKKENAKLKNEISRSIKKIDSFKNSNSWKIGRLITFPFRYLKKVFK